MKIKGVLLATVEEQRAGGDPLPVDPSNVRLIRSDEHVPVMIDFDPAKVLGRVTRTWLEAGRLMFEADLRTAEFGRETSQASAGLTILATEGKEVRDAGLWGISLTDRNVNRDQPPWEKIDG